MRVISETRRDRLKVLKGASSGRDVGVVVGALVFVAQLSQKSYVTGKIPHDSAHQQENS